jgi:hypothetical protein
MKTEVIEKNILIANRIAPGDRWRLVMEGSNGIIYPSLTEALDAYFQESGNRCDFKLSPLDSKLYAILSEEQEVVIPEPKKYSIYGDYEF